MVIAYTGVARLMFFYDERKEKIIVCTNHYQKSQGDQEAAFERCAAQPSTFAGDARHTGVYTVPAQHLNLVRWSTVIDPLTSGSGAHYGAPVISPSNTLFVPVTTSTGFKVNALECRARNLIILPIFR